MPRYRAALIDLGGVVFTGDEAVTGSVEAVKRLRDGGVGIRFLTNTTRIPRRAVVEKLNLLGIEVSLDEVFTPAIAAKLTLSGRVLHLLVHPSLTEDFEEQIGEPSAVIVGDAGEAFSYASMNEAFRALDHGADLFALAKNRNFRDADGELSLDAGPFVAAFEYASGREAKIIGKPAEAFFNAALDSLDVTSDEAVMIGDDVESDVAGAMAVGIYGILVRTGKYGDGDEDKMEGKPTAVVDDLSAAADWILKSESSSKRAQA